MNKTKIYNLHIPSEFPKGHRREGKPTLFGTKILNTLESGGGWRKTFILKHGFRGWQYKIDNVIKGYAKLRITAGQTPVALLSNVFYQKVHITYDVTSDILEFVVDGHPVSEELFLSGIGLSHEDFVSLHMKKRNNKETIYYDGIMIILSPYLML